MMCMLVRGAARLYGFKRECSQAECNAWQASMAARARRMSDEEREEFIEVMDHIAACDYCEEYFASGGVLVEQGRQ